MGSRVMTARHFILELGDQHLEVEESLNCKDFDEISLLLHQSKDFYPEDHLMVIVTQQFDGLNAVLSIARVSSISTLTKFAHAQKILCAFFSVFEWFKCDVRDR